MRNIKERLNRLESARTITRVELLEMAERYKNAARVLLCFIRRGEDNAIWNNCSLVTTAEAQFAMIDIGIDSSEADRLSKMGYTAARNELMGLVTLDMSDANEINFNKHHGV